MDKARICTASSQVTLGNGATAEYRAYANWSNISDGRFKKNIKQNVPGLAFINKLQPITYTLDATGLDNFMHTNQTKDKKVSEQSKTVMSKALAEKEKTILENAALTCPVAKSIHPDINVEVKFGWKELVEK